MSNKKVFYKSNTFTPINFIYPQELKVKQLLASEFIPFEYQKVFRVGKRRFIVDFFLYSHIILECSSTSMKKYQVPLRKKAIYIQAKANKLSSAFNHPVWVLLEATHPIGERFYQTLIELMPSVDQILTSCNELLELLFQRKNRSSYSLHNFQFNSHLKQEGSE